DKENAVVADLRDLPYIDVNVPIERSKPIPEPLTHRLAPPKRPGEDPRRIPEDDVIGEVPHCALVVTLVHGRNDVSDDLDVLLRHRLLRQPRSFEGLGSAFEGFDPNDLGAPQAVHDRIGDLDGYTALLAGAPLTVDHDYVLAAIDRLLDLQPPVVECA